MYYFRITPMAVTMPDPIHLAKLVNKAIHLHRLDISEFAVLVVGSSRQDVDKLLSNGRSSLEGGAARGWLDLTDVEREGYHRMSEWLQKSIEGNYFLCLILKMH